jgi:hypothetical protein
MCVHEVLQVLSLDIDFSAELGEWDSSLVTVGLPCLLAYSEHFPCDGGFKPFVAEVLVFAFC